VGTLASHLLPVNRLSVHGGIYRVYARPVFSAALDVFSARAF